MAMMTVPVLATSPLERKRQELRERIEWLKGKQAEMWRHDYPGLDKVKMDRLYLRNISELESKLENAHQCPCCGLILTSPCSIRNGIGPECAKPDHIVRFPCRHHKEAA